MKTTLQDWVIGAYQAGYEAAWLPIKRNKLNDVERHLDDLNDWFKTVEGSSYSPVKDFLASFDHPTQGLPAPFNAESMPMYMRTAHKMKGKLLMHQFWDEFGESVGFRF